MTANNFQALCAERAQLIGFPPSVTVPTGEMGLANANILRGSAISSNTNHNINNNNNNNENDSNNNNHNNSISNKLSAKRCLFGSPAKGETQHIYNNYMEVKRQEFRDRFGFDIIQGCPVTQTEQFIDKEITTTTATTTTTTTAVSSKLSSSKSVKGSSKLVDNSNSKTTIEHKESFSEVVDDNKISGECRLQEGNHHNESDTDNETDTCNQDINSSRCSTTTTTSNSNINSSAVQSSTNNSSQKDKRTTERFQPYSKRQQNESTDKSPKQDKS